MEDRIAFEAEGVQSLTYLSEAWARSLSEAVIHPTGIVSSHRHAPQCLGGFATQVKRAKPPCQALPDGAPIGCHAEDPGDPSRTVQADCTDSIRRHRGSWSLRREGSLAWKPRARPFEKR